MRWASLARELKDRKLVQWGVGYLAGAWVLLEFVDFLSTTFTWPQPVVRVLTVVVLFGFLAVLVFAWYHGERGHQKMKPTEAVLLLLIAGAATAVSWRVASPPSVPETQADSATLTNPPPPLILQTSADDRKSIAVRPFTNITSDPANEYFSDGITEDIIARLSRINGLRVISRTSVMQYKRTDKTIRQIGQELNVEYVLEGSVRREGNNVRIVAQLIDARTDEHMWSDTFDRRMQDILAVQSEIAEKIADALQAELTPGVLAELREQPQVDPDAYNLYVQGARLAKSDAPEEFARALDLLDQAIEKDSNLVGAYAAIAEAIVPPTVGLGQPLIIPDARVEETMRRAERRHATAETHTWQIRRAMERWDFSAAEEAAKRAVDANPNYAAGHQRYGNLLARAGRYDEALTHLNMARSLDPRSPAVNADLGELLYTMGRFDEAIAQLRATLQLDSAATVVYTNLGLAYQAKGLHGDAVSSLRRAESLARQNPVVQGYLGFVLAEAGDSTEAHRILDGLEQRGLPPAGAIAQVLVGLGDTANAMAWLQKAVDERSQVLLSPRVNRALEGLQGDPRFLRLMRIRPPSPDSLPARQPPRPSNRGS